jgi:hypothetical protein
VTISSRKSHLESSQQGRVRSGFTWIRKLLLGSLCLCILLLGVDALRQPQQQVSVRLFSAVVVEYHRYVHPLTVHFIRCRYLPTCSAYAEQAVRRYGIGKGSWMAMKRIARCGPSVPMGTLDPLR